ncbi:uncharacterized protein LTR77_005370 [Saxophila tyrrhenica]|uniref:polynucleotide adenylyltransferase n=1 Tax=Saxophila tyrrhenica TaxID=1690608 RepID=A0AAV9P8Y1_9PEZI|nr:hypothetical protein LTR77_005370 [Saxophila tyrrhenica]
MDGHTPTLSPDMEEQIRGMILSESPSTSSGPFDASAGNTAHPAVRLPPSTMYGQPPPKQFAPPPYPQNQEQFHHQRQQPDRRWQGERNFNAAGGVPPPQNPPYGRQQQPPYAQRPARGNYSQQHGHYPPPNGRGGPPPSFATPHQQRARHQQQMQLDPNAFQRGGFAPPPRGRGQGPQQLFNPHQPRAPMPNQWWEPPARQKQYLETLAAEQISKVEMSSSEYREKESFRATLERICLEVCESNPDRLPRISLEPFGSFKSGFASAGSDMDLVIVVKDRSSTTACFSLLEDDLPRALEKRLLELGIGARLLTRTRVPIIKVCEKPEDEFLGKLREEREKWDVLPEKEKYPHLHSSDDDDAAAQEDPPIQTLEADEAADVPIATVVDGVDAVPQPKSNGKNGTTGHVNGHTTNVVHQQANGVKTGLSSEPTGANAAQKQRRPDNKPWTRERKAGPLDFPSSGVGIQCDINFFNPLGLHNTQLLRCYSLSDPRVRPMVLFVKAWAKHRKINSSYSGTLSSYGFVLMVLHYLINVANPPVLRNLQAGPMPPGVSLPEGVEVDGWHVRFWRNETEITEAVQRRHMSINSEPVGSLLAGFFHYYSSLGGGNTFRWMNEVLSLRSPHGILTKEEKGWVRAVTEEGEGKKIQHRYLFCIEDPFELSHNVARTVTHKGIVAIRDEFRRAHRILLSVGYGNPSQDGELFDDLVEAEELPSANTATKMNGTTMGPDERNNTAHQQQRAPTHQLPHRPRSGVQQQPLPSRPNTKLFNPGDNDAFPALSTPSPKGPQPKKKSRKSPQETKDVGDDFSEISGDKAKAILEEVKRKKDEKQAEDTATLAAESVLDGID